IRLEHCRPSSMEYRNDSRVREDRNTLVQASVHFFEFTKYIRVSNAVGHFDPIRLVAEPRILRCRCTHVPEVQETLVIESAKSPGSGRILEIGPRPRERLDISRNAGPKRIEHVPGRVARPILDP